jgi:hypothetical protein
VVMQPPPMRAMFSATRIGDELFVMFIRISRKLHRSG